jgi:FtsH-binding integral membrane protein
MAWQSPGSQTVEGLSSNQSILAEESARVFMGRVYRWMIGGLALTGATAIGVASSPELSATVLGLFGPIVIAELILVIALSFIAPRVSGAVAAVMFLGYAFLTGLTFSVLFLAYTGGSIASAFFVTSGAFAALSIYGTVTKKDLSAWGTFLFMGLIGLILAGVVNFFLHSSAITFVCACAGVVVFAGLTAYDTQRLRRFHAESGYSSSGSLAITGALILYLDFVNLFLKILQLLGKRR